MRYLAASADPNHFLTTVSHYMIGLGGALGALMLVVIGFKVLAAGARSGRNGEEGSGLRDAVEAAGTVFLGLLFIFGAVFIIGIMTSVVTAIQK